jgi:hypothetical protein
MLYSIYYKDGTRHTVISLKPLTAEEVEAQVRAREDFDQIEAYYFNPNDIPSPERPGINGTPEPDRGQL